MTASGMNRLSITQDNLSPLVEIVTWLSLVISTLTILIRFLIKVCVIRALNYDDALIVLSLLFATAQSIVLSVATSNGLGQRLDSLTVSQISNVLKTQYTANILFIISDSLAKLALSCFILRLTPKTLRRNLAWGTNVGIGVWTVTGILGSAFQCNAPKPWDYLHGHCFNRTAFNSYVAIGNIITDFCLVALPIFITIQLKVKRSERIALGLVFFVRICVIIAVICQLVFLNRLGPRNDPLHDIWPVAVCTQIAQCVAIVTACTIYLKPCLDALESGFIQIDDLRRQQVEGYGFDPEDMTRQGSKNPKSSQSSRIVFSFIERLSQKQIHPHVIELQAAKQSSSNKIGNNIEAHVSNGAWNGDSTLHIIETRTWTVRDD